MTGAERLFIGLALDEELRRSMDDAASRVGLSGFRRTPPAQLHLTVRFLGATPVSRRRDVEAALARAAARHRPFELPVVGGGTFGPPGAPRVAWIGVDDTGASLGALVAAVEDELSTVGFEREPRPYHPHITLGRARGRATVDEAALRGVPRLGTLRVHELVLFRSDTDPAGARYTPLHRVALRGAAP